VDQQRDLFISYTGADQAWAEWTGTQDVNALEEQAVAPLQQTFGAERIDRPQAS
jgi:hypothetical protein